MVGDVFSWQPAVQGYSWWFKGAPTGVNTLASLSAGSAAWIQATAACVWRPSPIRAPVQDVALLRGWNNLPYNAPTLAVDKALTNCVASVDSVFQWGNTAQAYTWWFKAGPPPGSTPAPTVAGSSQS